MPLDLIPESIRENYETYEWKHATAILNQDFPDEWRELIEVLESFRLLRSEIKTPGGSKSPIAKKIDSELYAREWIEKAFDIEMRIDERGIEIETHKVDCFKNQVGIEIEWNNKDPFYDRDLNNFRLLFELRALSVGVIITRCDELQEIFVDLGKGASYGASTTHMSKLLPRIEGGGGGGCPLLVFGISRQLYVEDD